MTFRDRMKVSISTAEDQLHAGLVRLKLTKGLYRNYAIRLKTLPNGRKRATRPDFCWPDRMFPFFLDGIKVHSTRGARLRDESITAELEAMGWHPLRESYRSPLSNKRREEILASLREALSK